MQVSIDETTSSRLKPRYGPRRDLALLAILLLAMPFTAAADDGSLAGATAAEFPRNLESYGDEHLGGIGTVLAHRIAEDPFNLIASLIFVCAIIHIFMAHRFLDIARRWSREHNAKKKQGLVDKNSVHIRAGIFHFFGEVETVFGIWAVALVAAITLYHDWATVVEYLAHGVNYTEPQFVVVIMALAATRPILKLSELIMWKVANLFGGMLGAWWLTILTLGPLLGSFITEPAAMTIAALLLSEKFYELEPGNSFKYATMGLLFVNISVGGSLTHFAAPPILMVAGPWDWGLGFMLGNFGWKAVLGIVIANAACFYLYRREMQAMQRKYLLVRRKRELQGRYLNRRQLAKRIAVLTQDVADRFQFRDKYNLQCAKLKAELRGEFEREARATPGIEDSATLAEAFDQRFEEIRLEELRRNLPGLLPEEQITPYHDPRWDQREDQVPMWIMLVHVGFLVWTVINVHHPSLFVAGFMFFFGFVHVTPQYQNRMDLRPPLMVGFFLSGLVVHGGLQGRWIAPVLGSLSETSLMLAASVLTAFNDNAAITYLSTLVPGLTDELKYAVVAGALTGGGLTVIANAPNPAGHSILSKYFPSGVSPMRLLKAALLPTLIMGCSFMLL